MRLLPLSLLVSSFLLPAAAFAAQADTACGFVDPEALSALGLGSPVQTLDHRDVPGQAGGAPQHVDTCTLTSSVGPFPMLVISTVSLPAGEHPNPAQKQAACQRQPQTGMWFTVCSAPVKDSVVSLVLLSEGSPNLTTEMKFQAQAKRLFARDFGGAKLMGALGK